MDALFMRHDRAFAAADDIRGPIYRGAYRACVAARGKPGPLELATALRLQRASDGRVAAYASATKTLQDALGRLPNLVTRADGTDTWGG